jgi:hypothetical protein
LISARSADLRLASRHNRVVKTGIVCFLLATLAGFRVVSQGMWNLEHTGEGFLGYEPMTQLLTLAIAVIVAIAGVYLIVRGSASRDKRPGTCSMRVAAGLRSQLATAVLRSAPHRDPWRLQLRVAPSQRSAAAAIATSQSPLGPLITVAKDRRRRAKANAVGTPVHLTRPADSTAGPSTAVG